MATHTNEGRRSTPERIPTLNPHGVEQFYAATHRNHLGEQLVLGSFREMYPERVRDLLGTPEPSPDTLMAQANQQAQDMRAMVGQEATQGAYMQAPGAWMPAEWTPADAPQGAFSPEEINVASSQPYPGFEQMYVPEDPQARAAEAQRDAATRFEEFVLGQEAVNNWDNPN